MTIRDLIRDLMDELDEQSEADRIYELLANNELAWTDVGVDDGSEIKYVSKIVNEFPSHFALVLERD